MEDSNDREERPCIVAPPLPWIFAASGAASVLAGQTLSGRIDVESAVPPARAAPTPPRVPSTIVRWDRNLAAHPSRGAYRRTLPMLVTAYLPLNEGVEGGRWTRTERDGQAVHGVAVDPRVIPLGSQLWIPGYGHAVADDIGSAIRGRRLDVRMQRRDSMNRWGVRRVSVYVLKDP